MGQKWCDAEVEVGEGVLEHLQGLRWIGRGQTLADEGGGARGGGEFRQAPQPSPHPARRAPLEQYAAGGLDRDHHEHMPCAPYGAACRATSHRRKLVLAARTAGGAVGGERGTRATARTPAP